MTKRKPKLPKFKPHWIYVIGLSGLNEYCKIGISNDPARRANDISTSNPFRPFVACKHLVRSERGARSIESECHDKLSQYRVNGEWFKLPPLVAWQTVKAMASAYNDRYPMGIFEATNFYDVRKSGTIFETHFWKQDKPPIVC